MPVTPEPRAVTNDPLLCHWPIREDRDSERAYLENDGYSTELSPETFPKIPASKKERKALKQKDPVPFPFLSSPQLYSSLPRPMSPKL